MLNNRIILGTVQFGISYGINNERGKPNKKEVLDILNHAKKSGIRYLDTAEAYGDSEEIIGHYNVQTDDFPFSIITKFHLDCTSTISKKVSDATRRLKVPAIDILLFHSYSDFKNSPKAINDLLEEKRKGNIKKIGVSVYQNSEIEELLSIPEVEVIQAPFNLLDNHSKRGQIFQEAKEMGKIIHTRSTFLQGLFFKDLASIPNNLSSLTPHLASIHELKIPIQGLALGYALAQPYIDGVLIGVDSVDQLENNIAKLTSPPTDEIVNYINEIEVEDIHLLNPSNWNL